MTIQALKETRASKLAEMRQINEQAMHDKRDLSGEERKRFDALDGEMRGLADQIERNEKLDAFERVQNAQPVSGNLPELRSYSLSKAITEGSNGRLTGLEQEVHQELSRDRAEVRGVMIPTSEILGGETRALTTTTPAAGVGGNMVSTDLAAMTDRRRAALKIEQMGATVLRGLTGNLDLPRLEKSGTSHWIGEHTNTTRSDAEFSKKSMGPKTVSAEYEVSRRMLLQSNEAIDPILRADLAFLLAQSLDSAAIRGGGADEPIGILSDADVVDIASAGDLRVTTSAMIAKLTRDDVTGTRAFLSHPDIGNLARLAADTVERPLPAGSNFHGERSEYSTQVPKDLGRVVI